MIVCGRCGQGARGFAMIGWVRYCHGDDDERPTCYQQESWARMIVDLEAWVNPIQGD